LPPTPKKAIRQARTRPKALSNLKTPKKSVRGEPVEPQPPLFSKESILQDAIQHGTGGSRWCCLGKDKIFMPECAVHKWHSH